MVRYDIRNNLGPGVRSQVQTLRGLALRVAENSRLRSDYFHSDDYTRILDDPDTYKEAYDRTLRWYEENDPEHLNLIRSMYGSSLTIDRLFGSDVDNAVDEIAYEGITKWYDKHGTSEDKIRSEREAYEKASKELTESLIGAYGNMRISRTDGKWSVDKLESIVGQAALEDLDKK